MKTAPLWRDAMSLAGVLLDELEGGSSYAPLRTRVLHAALELLDRVNLALGDFDRDAQVERADELVCMLRAHLLLAHELGLLDEDLYLSTTEHLDEVGRQIGGWRKRLGHGRASDN